jgi:hypothetical protein
MDKRQQIVGVGCGALAGLTAGVVVTLWQIEAFLYFSIYDPFLYIYDLLYALWYGGSIGLIIGTFMGAFMVVRMQNRVWQLPSWIGIGLLFGIVSLSPYLILLLLFWLGARIGISSAGEPSEWVRGIIRVLLVGGLAGSTGGCVGGYIFTRYAG